MNPTTPTPTRRRTGPTPCGTQWTPRGAGSTVRDLLAAAVKAEDPITAAALINGLMDEIDAGFIDYQTNLILTDAPLTTADAKRFCGRDFQAVWVR